MKIILFYILHLRVRNKESQTHPQLVPYTPQQTTASNMSKGIQDFTWARLGMAESDVELYLHADFASWIQADKSLTFSGIQRTLMHTLQRAGFSPVHVKANHMATGSLFVVLPSLREAYDVMQFLQEETFAKRLILPSSLTVDWSHSQMAVFNQFCDGDIPDKFYPWPRPGMKTEPVMGKNP